MKIRICVTVDGVKYIGLSEVTEKTSTKEIADEFYKIADKTSKIMIPTLNGYAVFNSEASRKAVIEIEEAKDETDL